MLVNTKEMLQSARNGKYGVAQPNVWDFQSMRAVIRACQSESAPVIMGLAEAHTHYMSVSDFAEMARYFAEITNVPIALHLDHGNTYKTIVQAIRAGFTSVMMDASSTPFEENVRRTKAIVEMAHACCVTVEAELGHVGVGSDYGAVGDILTDPDEAERFVSETGVDSLAVSIGTAHGVYKGVPKLDYDRLAALRAKVSVPLVLHGGSGTGDEAIAKCITLGISKVNICTDLMIASAEGYDAAAKEMSAAAFADCLLEGEKGYIEKLRHYIRVFGASGRMADVRIKKAYEEVNKADIAGDA